ncbi:MAG: sialate O-acetylesterase, partial [Kiritimatiellales bacterium]|nr:sialate O-acetylesterase [Kiritimatiellales bacterium]
QTFPSDTWSDVAFDGTRYLVVRTAKDGAAGIYQYDPQTDSFALASGTETYSDWNGLGAYVASGDPAATPPPHVHGKTIYVVLFGGQSNARGWGYRQYLLDTKNPLAEPQADVDLFTGTGLPALVDTLTQLQSGSGITGVKKNGTMQYPALATPPVNRFGPELSLGRTVRDLIHIPDSKVAVIKYAASNTTLYEDWKPDGTASDAADGPEYRKFQTTVRNGLAALAARYPDYKINIIGMGWVQGESDALEDQSASYQANLSAFITDIRATFGTNIVFALSELSPNQKTTAAWNTVRNAQEAVAATMPHVVATATTGTNYPTAGAFTEGSLHYLSSALLRIGQDLGKAIGVASGLE